MSCDCRKPLTGFLFTRIYCEQCGGKLTKPYDYTGAIIAFESGELDSDAVVELFQYLIDTGLAWQLQGSYGRTAVALIQNGDCTQ